MPFHGSIVVIKRTGADGSIFPLVSDVCLLGRAEGCDIRVQLPTVSKEHCKITVRENQQVLITSIATLPTQLNGEQLPVGGARGLSHGDIFTLGDRSFRWEYPEGSIFLSKSPSTAKAAGSSKLLARKSTDGLKATTPKSKPLTPRAATSPKKTGYRKYLQPQVDESAAKRVSFGPYISPEYIDKTLPASSPVRKGAAAPRGTPLAVAATPTSLLKKSLKKRAMLATASTESGEEDCEPKGVLMRSKNDTPLLKDSSGHRSSPRSPTTPSSAKKRDRSNSPKKAATSSATKSAPASSKRKRSAETPAATPAAPPSTSKSTRKTPGKKAGAASVKKTVKKRLWTDVVKKTPAITAVSKARRASLAVKRPMGKKKQALQYSEDAMAPKSKTTGHALSPESIVIKKKTRVTPAPTRKGRKTPLKVAPAARKGKDLDFEGLADLLKTPVLTKARGPKTPTSAVSPKRTPARKSPLSARATPVSIQKPRVSSMKKSSVKKTPKTPDFEGLADLLKTPVPTKGRGPKTPTSAVSPKRTPARKSPLSARATPVSIQKTRVSSVKKSSVKKTPKTPDFEGLADLLKTPVPTKVRGPKTPTSAVSPKRTPARKSPLSARATPVSIQKTRVSSVKKTPKTPDFEGLADLLKTPVPTKVRGPKTPTSAVSPKRTPARKSPLSARATPVSIQKTQVSSVKKTPKTPDFKGLADLLKTPVPTKVRGQKTPTSAVSPKRTPARKSPLSARATPVPIQKTPASLVRKTSKTPGSAKTAPSLTTPGSGRKGAPLPSTQKTTLVSPKKTPVRKSPMSARRDVPATPMSPRTPFGRTPFTPGNLNMTVFDFSAVQTPNIPLETFVSPLTQTARKSPKSLMRPSFKSRASFPTKSPAATPKTKSPSSLKAKTPTPKEIKILSPLKVKTPSPKKTNKSPAPAKRTTRKPAAEAENKVDDISSSPVKKAETPAKKTPRATRKGKAVASPAKAVKSPAKEVKKATRKRKGDPSPSKEASPAKKTKETATNTEETKRVRRGATTSIVSPAKSPLKRVARGKAKVVTPKQTKAPAKRTARKQAVAVEKVKIDSSPVKKAETPVTNTPRVARRGKAAASPAKKSPAKAVKSPAKVTATRKRKGDPSPSKEESPTKKKNVTAEEPKRVRRGRGGASPVASPTPVKKQSPAKRVARGKAKIVTPKKVNSPDKTKSPAAPAKRATRKQATVAKDDNSSVKKVETPVKKTPRATRKGKAAGTPAKPSPAKDVKSPAKKVTAGRKRKVESSPVKTVAASPKKTPKAAKETAAKKGAKSTKVVSPPKTSPLKTRTRSRK